MKKLMTLVVAVGMASIASAASISWKSGTISLPTGGSGVTGYLFLVDEATYGTYSAYTDATKLSDDIYAAYSGSFASADGTSSKLSKGAMTLTDGVDTYGAGSELYAVILYTTKVDTDDYYMGNYGYMKLTSDQSDSLGSLALKMGGTGNATAWSTAAVPEPTSGLLMLLGMAGLALRRRRA